MNNYLVDVYFQLSVTAENGDKAEKIALELLAHNSINDLEMCLSAIENEPENAGAIL